eukprot:gb/GECH01013959.1/.p1 GENE.gb/GECH01013959.1/~~gb/GECH01013959.1/.p1  ORF type:complete len:461 (+),score=151.23 gb/GECH01013959.1/:1-1383(+)
MKNNTQGFFPKSAKEKRIKEPEFPSFNFQRRIPKQIPEQLNRVGEHLYLFTQGKPKDRIHSGFVLKSLSSKPELRLSLAMTGDFIECICLILSEDANESDAARRCQQHSLSIIVNILLEDPVLDTFIAHEENCIPGISKALCSEYQLTQELAATAIDYICVMEDNRSLVCCTEGMLDSLAKLLQYTDSLLARKHCLQAILYLSQHSRNRFILARNFGLLDEIEDSFFVMDYEVVSLCTRIVYELSQARENIIKLVEHPELMMRILDILYEEDLEQLNATDEVQKIAKDIVEAVEKRFSHGTNVNIKDILARFNAGVVGNDSNVDFSQNDDEDDEFEEQDSDEYDEDGESDDEQDDSKGKRRRRSNTILKQQRAQKTLQDALDQDFEFHIPEDEDINESDILPNNNENIENDEQNREPNLENEQPNDNKEEMEKEPFNSQELESVRQQFASLVGGYGSDSE